MTLGGCRRAGFRWPVRRTTRCEREHEDGDGDRCDHDGDDGVEREPPARFHRSELICRLDRSAQVACDGRGHDRGAFHVRQRRRPVPRRPHVPERSLLSRDEERRFDGLGGHPVCRVAFSGNCVGRRSGTRNTCRTTRRACTTRFHELGVRAGRAGGLCGAPGRRCVLRVLLFRRGTG